jgi:cell division protein FtsN
VPPKATADLAPGQWAVQVAVFMTPASAEAQRGRVATQLRAASMPESESTRIVKREDRYFVVVGNVADRAQAEALASQLRTTLQRDVVVFRR